MKRLSYVIAMMLVGVVLASCTLTVVPGEQPQTRQQTRPEVVTTRPSSSIIVITPTHPRNEQIIYQCSGSRLLVRYLDRYDHAEIFYDGQWNRLNRDRSVSGEVYANNTYRWDADGRKGTLQKNGSVVVRDCKY